MKSAVLSDFLTDAEILRVLELWRTLHRPGVGGNAFVTAIEREIIAPVLPRINAALGQENDARYLAYAVEYTFLRSM
jgi:hypothetical protein